MPQNPASFTPDSFIPDSFVPDPVNQQQPAPTIPNQQGWFEKLLGGANTPLLPEYKGATAPGSYRIPGMGIYSPQIPDLSSAYNDIIRPLSSPLVLASGMLEGIPAIMAGRGKQPIVAKPKPLIPEGTVPTSRWLEGKAPQRLALPPAGGTSPSPTRFYASKYGIGDTAQQYPYDITDYAKIRQQQNMAIPEGMPTKNLPAGIQPGQIVQPGATLLPEELGSQADVGAEIAAGFQKTTANRRQLGHLADLVPERMLQQETTPPLQRGLANPSALPNLESAQVTRGRTLPTISERPLVSKELPYDPNRFERTAPGRPPTNIEKLGKALELNPEFRDGNKAKPAIDVINSTPTKSIEPADNVLPKAGQASPKLGKYESNFNSPNKVLSRYPETAPAVAAIVRAEDIKVRWIAATERELAGTTAGLNKAQRIELWDALQGKRSNNPIINERAQQARNILDNVFASVKRSGQDMGYTEDYITHIQRQPEGIQAAIKDIFNYHGMPDAFAIGKGEPTGTIGNFFEKALGQVTSPFTKRRSGKLTELETDPNRIFPIYVESIAKVIHDRPAIEFATKQLKNVPEGALKELLAAHIKNYTRFDAEPELHNAWAKFSNQIATISSRSFINMNPVVHMYHVGQIPANIYPELGAKFTALGFKDFVTKPIQNFREMAQNGLLQSEIKPYSFRTPGEKMDSIMYGMSTIESMVKGTAFNGFKRKFLQQGMKEHEATMAAIDKAKDATMTVSPARQMKGFTPESNFIGGEYGSRNTMQFKQIPMKIVEQYTDIAKQFKSDNAKFRRAVWGASVAAAGSAAGFHTLHMSPMSMAQTGALGGINDTLVRVLYDLGKGDVGKAIEDTAVWVIPGGNTLRKLVK